MKAIQSLHIISFQNPYPPVYGGIIDVYYKAKALHEIGVKLYFHCFVDVKTPDISALEQISETVFVYRRSYKWAKLFSRYPYSVVSRYKRELYTNLNAIDAPILCEGLQSSFVLHQHEFPTRLKMLRLHNVESNYYHGLANSETRFWKRYFLQKEAIKYQKYQAVLSRFDRVFALSHFENNFVSKAYGNSQYLPVFHGNKQPTSLSEFGDFSFYHGDLRLADNRKAVAYLIDIFAQLPEYQFVIAASNGKKYVQKRIEKLSNCTFVLLKTKNQLNMLLASAQINVMVSFQESGTKLKTINSLYKSRHCVINSNMIDDPQIQALCTVAQTQEEFITAITRLRFEEFTEEMQNQRKVVFEQILSDQKNAQELVDYIERHQNKP